MSPVVNAGWELITGVLALLVQRARGIRTQQ
ncbi:hypothetical protein BJY26_001908 [Spelaeicoccus albus]|uniref:Uncharacterized protein n=1 Tax=Spelaeicoccus albus TaxID=1280376 RepID=A0A7Z0D2D7_9MICO|nr:hypothetical protein [Spelaeicoccus albus]